MGKKCAYNVNGGPPPKDTSFRSFVCALLVFLALCLIIYLILVLVNRKGGTEGGPKKEVEVLEGGNTKSQSDKLFAVNVPDEPKEYERTTDGGSRKNATRVEETTKRTRTRYEQSSTLGNDIDNVPVTEQYPIRKIPVYTKEDVQTTTDLPSPSETGGKEGAVDSRRTTTTTTSEATIKHKKVLPAPTKDDDVLTTTDTSYNTESDQNVVDESTTRVYDRTTWKYIKTWLRQNNAPPYIAPTTDGTTEESDQNVVDEATTSAYDRTTWKYIKTWSRQNNTPPYIAPITDATTEESDQNVVDESTTSVYDRTTWKNIKTWLRQNNAPSYIAPTTDGTTEESDQNVTDESTTSAYDRTTWKYIKSWLRQNNAPQHIVPITDTTTEESVTTEDNKYLTTTDITIDFGINDTLFYDNNRNQHPPSSTTKEDDAEESTSESILSSSETSYLGPYKRRSTTEQNVMETEEYTPETSTQNAYQKINRYTTTDAYENVNESTGDLTTETEVERNWESTTGAYRKASYRVTTEEGTTESEESPKSTEETSTVGSFRRLSVRNETRGTTTVSEETDTTTDVYRNARVFNKYTMNVETTTDADVTESADLATTESIGSTEKVIVRNKYTTESGTTTSEMLTTTRRRNPFTTQPVRPVTSSSKPTCKSPVCKKAASRLLYLMNHEADPCDDFYSFACGGQKVDEGFAKRQDLKALINYLEDVEETSDKYLYNFKKLYTSCVTYEENFKFSPRLEFLSNNSVTDLTELFAELILTQSMPLFDVGLDIDASTQTYILEITLPGRSSLTANTRGWPLTEQIKTQCLNTLKLMRLNSTVDLDDKYEWVMQCQKESFRNISENFVEEMNPGFSRYDPVYNKTNLNNLVEILRKLQVMLPSDDDVRRALSKKNDYSSSEIADLKDSMDIKVDWEVLFNRLTFRGALDRNLVIYFSSNINRLFQYLNDNFNEAELINALQLYSKLQLYVNVVVSKQRESREMYCMDLAKQLMPDTVSVITYSPTANHYPTIFNVRTLFARLKAKLDESVSNSKMDDASKNMVRDKLKKISLGLITTGDHSTANANNGNMRLTEDGYEENVLESLRNYRRIVYSLAGANATAATLLRYFVDPFDTKPKSFSASNIIVTQPAFFESNPTMSPTNFGLATIGMHLSRELAKLVITTDTQGTYYTDLDQRTEDLLLFFANYTYDMQDSLLEYNTSRTLWKNEMMADNAAFKLILDYYNEIEGQVKPENMVNLPWISGDYPVSKAFFIVAAQEYCKEYTPLDFMEDAYVTGNLPPPLKIQNFVSNSLEFSDLFECSDGSSMTIPDGMSAQFPYIDYVTNYDYSSYPSN